jgi:LDH2 family malate/lactate/ureidoglycolate dehydrogenase
MDNGSKIVHHQNLFSYVKAIFLAVGLNELEAELIASHLVAANLRGVDSHGVSRVALYVKRMLNGLVRIGLDYRVEHETLNSALIDGLNSNGILVAQKAIELAVEKALNQGLGIVGVANSNHCGMLAFYSQYAIERDCIAIVTTNASPAMAPWGGKEKFFGTNPLCYGIPAGEEKGIILDMATSVVARGKIRLAAKNNQAIPPGWAITKDGKETSDPHEALDGLVLPFGGYKGYGLVFLIETLSSIVTGAQYGPHVGSIVGNKTQGVGHFFLVMRADLFMPIEAFKARMDRVIAEIRSVGRMEGVERIYLPGEIEMELAAKRREQGIPLSLKVYEELVDLGKQLGVEQVI